MSTIDAHVAACLQVFLGASPYDRTAFSPFAPRPTPFLSDMPTPPEPFASLVASRRRFDWWQALVRVLSSIEAVRDGHALYVLLASFCGAGLATASAMASFGREDVPWAIGQGAAA